MPSNMSASEVSSLINTKLDNLQKQEETLAAPEETPSADATAIAAAEAKEAEALKESADEQIVAVEKQHLTKTTTVRLNNRVRDAIETNLEKYTNAKLSARERVQALAKLIEGVTKQPKKDILDNILAFFYKHKDDELMQEANALQGLTVLDKNTHYRARMFYMVMISLARGIATRSNTSVEAIRTLFRTDDFANWVAMQLTKRAR